MTPKSRVIRALSGESVDPPPVVLHSWGGYKVELAGLHPKFQYYLGGSELAEIERAFYDQFRPDWMHLGSAGWRGFWDRQRKVEGNRAFLQSDRGWVEIREDYSLEDYSDVPWWGSGPVLRLSSKSEIDDYYASTSRTEQEVLDSGRFEHMSILAGEFGESMLIAVNDGAPGSWLPDHSYEEALIACVEQPDLMRYCVFKDCQRFLADVRAAKASGAHAYIFSEGFCGSLDAVSPEMHERLEAETKRWFYSEVRKIGILPIGYFLGDVRPNMRWINTLDMAGLMIEESKKRFTLDPVEIRKALRPEVCLFGNADSLLVKQGTPEEIREEVGRQKVASEFGSFVPTNGSPLIVGTPPENVEIFMEQARGKARGERSRQPRPWLSDQSCP